MLSFRWNVHSDPEFYHPSDVRPGHFYAINRTVDLASIVGSFFELFASNPAQASAPPMPPADYSSSSFHPEPGEENEATIEVDEEDAPLPPSHGFFDDEKKTTQSGTSKPTASSLFFSLPHQDLEGKGLVMSISQAFYDNVSVCFYQVVSSI